MRFENDSDSCCKCFLVDLGYVFFYREITQIGRKNDLVSESGENRASIRGEEILRKAVQRRDYLLILVLTVNGGK